MELCKDREFAEIFMKRSKFVKFSDGQENSQNFRFRVGKIVKIAGGHGKNREIFYTTSENWQKFV